MTMRVERIGDATLYLGDCLEILPTLGKVDAVVTDPPYGTKTNQRAEWMVGEFSNVLPLALPLIYRALETDGAFYCFTSWSKMADWLLRYQQYFKLQNIIIWDKRRHSGCWSQSAWQFTWEGIFFGIKGPRKIREYLPDVISSEETGKRIAMQKPADVVGALIRASTDEGDDVLDPFMGSGSTGVACAKLGRKFIGIEIEPKYFDIACKRIEEAYAQGDMFIEPPKKAEQSKLALEEA